MYSGRRSCIYNPDVLHWQHVKRMPHPMLFLRGVAFTFITTNNLFRCMSLVTHQKWVVVKASCQTSQITQYGSNQSIAVHGIEQPE